MGIIKRTAMAWTTWALLGLSPALASDPPPSTSQLLASERVAEARRLVADAIPEERLQIEQLLIEAIRIDPHSAEAYAELARYQLWEANAGLRAPADLVEALEFAEHVRSLEPHRPLGDFVKCELLFSLGRPQEAEKSCIQAEKAFPDHKDTETFRTRFQAEKEPRAALEAAQRALALGASPDLLSGAISTALSKLAKERSAGDTLARFARIHPDRWIWHRAALAYVGEKRFGDAKRGFEKAIELGNELEARLQLALLSQTHLRDARGALREYGTLLRTLTARGNARKDIVAGIRARKALAHLEVGEGREAVLEAARALMEDVENERLIQAVYEAFSRKKLGGELERPFRHVATENPFLLYAHTTLGEISTGKKAYGEAILHFSRATALAPDDDGPVAARAHVHYTLKDYESALRDFDVAIRNRPQEPTHHYNRACMLTLLGKEREALASLRTAILMDRSLARVASADADLTRLREDAQLKTQLANLGLFDGKEAKESGVTASTESSSKE